MGGLPAAAAAALGAIPEPPQPERIAWVDIESPPSMVGIDDPSTGERLGNYARFDDALPLTDLMADKARAVCDRVDENGCEAEACVASPYERDGVPVGSGIGWVLAGDADERVEWAPVTLVQRGRAVMAVCSECSPSALYQRLWES